MLADHARIKVTAGAGGNGCCSFRREKYVPRGGPDGGDGGRGGDIVMEADARVNALMELRYHSTWRGEKGEHGRGKNQHGKHGGETVIRVPPGTVIHDYATGEVLAELLTPGERYLAVRGGSGGKGNARFATATNRTPRFAEKGEPGEEAELFIELKLIAEVGITGLPNAGKSSLLARVTRAAPKIGDYPFTTVAPNLGVAELPDARSLTFADIPGIIEGAAEGKGLGHDFLRHIERTKVLLILLDGAGDVDPLAARDLLLDELGEYSPELLEKPRVYALNKADLPESRARYEALQGEFGELFLVSAATGEGTAELLEDVWRQTRAVEEDDASAVDAEATAESYAYEVPYTIERTPDGFRVEGKGVLRAVRMTDFENRQAVAHLQHKLRRMGLFKALKRQGAKQGHVIHIGDEELEYEPDER